MQRLLLVVCGVLFFSGCANDENNLSEEESGLYSSELIWSALEDFEQSPSVTMCGLFRYKLPPYEGENDYSVFATPIHKSGKMEYVFGSLNGEASVSGEITKNKTVEFSEPTPNSVETLSNFVFSFHNLKAKERSWITMLKTFQLERLKRFTTHSSKFLMKNMKLIVRC